VSRRLIKALEPFDPMWVEEPVQFDDVEALLSLQQVHLSLLCSPSST
jgi:L-alanine-DL-glutamate epimerase-like enolase superfamily enzyme